MYITDFMGVRPSVDPSLLPSNYAVVAENVDLRDGTLRPWLAPSEETVLEGNPCRATTIGCKWCGSCDPDMFWVRMRWQDKTVRSTPRGRPQISESVCSDYCNLGFPQPDTPEASGTLGCDEHAEIISYVITYGDSFFEGVPSMPTAAMANGDKIPVTITLPQPQEGWCVDFIYIYRLTSTWDATQGLHVPSGQGPEGHNGSTLLSGWIPPEVDSEFFLVGKVPVGTTTFVDDANDAACEGLGRTLSSWDNAPPACSMVIVGETESGSMVGYEGNNLWLSKRYHVHAWPVSGCIDIGCEIRGASIVGESVYVLTDGYPFLVRDPLQNKDDGVRQVTRIDKHLPCVSAKGIVSDGGGVFYPSTHGIVVVSGTDARVATRDFFSQAAWDALQPWGMTMAMWRGMLFFSTCNGSYVLDLSGSDGHSRSERATLSTLSLCPMQWLTDKSGELFFLDSEGRVYRWAGGSENMVMTWRQVSRSLNNIGKVTAGKVEFAHSHRRHDLASSTTRITFLADNMSCYWRPVKSSKPFRTSAMLTAELAVEVSGRDTIRAICYGSGFSELIRMGTPNER